MSSAGTVNAAVVELRGALAKAKESDPQVRQMIEAEGEVIAKYQPMFAPDRIASLTEDEFRGFLYVSQQPALVGAATHGTSHFVPT